MKLFSTLLTKWTQTTAKKNYKFFQKNLSVHYICTNFDALEKKVKFYIHVEWHKQYIKNF